MKPPKRCGAFLRLYGPRGAPTHAKLVLGHAPRAHTPEAFAAELHDERRRDYQARCGRIDAVMRVVFEPGY